MARGVQGGTANFHADAMSSSAAWHDWPLVGWWRARSVARSQRRATCSATPRAGLASRRSLTAWLPPPSALSLSCSVPCSLVAHAVLPWPSCGNRGSHGRRSAARTQAAAPAEAAAISSRQRHLVVDCAQRVVHELALHEAAQHEHAVADEGGALLGGQRVRRRRGGRVRDVLFRCHHREDAVLGLRRGGREAAVGLCLQVDVRRVGLVVTDILQSDAAAVVGRRLHHEARPRAAVAVVVDGAVGPDAHVPRLAAEENDASLRVQHLRGSGDGAPCFP